VAHEVSVLMREQVRLTGLEQMRHHSLMRSFAGSSNPTVPTVDQNTNRFNTGQGFVYDKNGNVTHDKDPLTQLDRSFVFDGDNKQSEVKDSNGETVGQYFYDGEGKRIKKATNAETTMFVYSSGKLIAEYSTQISQTPTVSYTTTDHLGSPRIITDQFGQVKSRRDFMPFGEEISPSVGSRSNAGLQYASASDAVRQKFTGYQKDTETSLDFAEARMYENRYGRFTAVDPLLASGKSANPQTFNRYAYVLGNPLSMTDPLGLDPWWKGNCKDGRCSYLEAKEKPTDGTWEPVTFNDRGYATVGEWNTTGKTAYLYAGGGQDFGSIARFSDAMFESERLANSWNDPKLLAIRHPEVAEQGGAVMAMGAPILNIVPGTYNLGAWGANKFGANLPYAPTLEPDENTPAIAKGFYYGTNAALVLEGGVSLFQSVRSGTAAFRAGGATFSEQLFNSATFGKDSRLFGNSYYGSAGMLNKPGFAFKIGWSGVPEEMNFVNPRYINGLKMDGSLIGRSSFTGGGRQFRLTAGVVGNKGSKHLYIPRTFVPDAIANFR
jgi:RHS repeat-associated protein